MCFFGSNGGLVSTGLPSPSSAVRALCVALHVTASLSLRQLCAQLLALRSPSYVFRKSRSAFLDAPFDFASSAVGLNRKDRRAFPEAHTSQKKVETRWSEGHGIVLGGAGLDSFCSSVRSSHPRCSVAVEAEADPAIGVNGLESDFGRGPAATGSGRGFGRECSLAAAVDTVVAWALSAAFAAEVSAHEQASQALPPAWA